MKSTHHRMPNTPGLPNFIWFYALQGVVPGRRATADLGSAFRSLLLSSAHEVLEPIFGPLPLRWVEHRYSFQLLGLTSAPGGFREPVGLGGASRRRLPLIASADEWPNLAAGALFFVLKLSAPTCP